MDSPLVSVIIPAYNSERFLGGAISSCLTQNYGRVEIVVVNDGSSDATGTIARSYGDLIEYVEQPNRGVSSARNAGVLASRGSYIALCDSDDILLPNHLENSLNLLMKHAGLRTWITNDATQLTDRGLVRRSMFAFGTPAPDKQLEVLASTNFVSIFSVFRREMFDELGGFDEALRYCEDWDFWLRASIRGWTAHFQRRPSALYRRTSGGLSSQKTEMAAAHKSMLRKVHRENVDVLPADMEQAVRRNLSRPSFLALRAEADDALRRRDHRLARLRLSEASAANPYDKTLRRNALAVKVLPPLAQVMSRRRSAVQG